MCGAAGRLSSREETQSNPIWWCWQRALLYLWIVLKGVHELYSGGTLGLTKMLNTNMFVAGLLFTEEFLLSATSVDQNEIFMHNYLVSLKTST